jgi:tyrosyl-tRNA synthetase
MSQILQQLKDRGSLHDVSHFDELSKLLLAGPVTFYCGFDPTADSLHAGSMLPLVMMARLQRAGHKPIALLGSATGMIGDPSGKSEERKLITEEEVRHNLEGIEKQVKLFLSAEGDNAFSIVRNDEWLKPVSFIDFLRDTGKHFSVNMMLAKESVKNRLENREQGISYTEFSYMLLQAYDFYWLYKNRGCRLQVGGSDQWGNITAGTELIRRRSPADAPQAYGATFPLLTTSTGAKFGKTEKGAIWLDAKRTSPYRFFQYWVNTTDEDVIRNLRLFTDLTDQEITELEKQTREKPQDRAAQTRLGQILTDLIHGESERKRAEQASKVLFGESLKDIDSSLLREIFSDVPSTEVQKSDIAAGVSIVDLLVRCSVADSKGAAKRLVEGGGIYLNNERVTDSALKVEQSRLIDGSILVLRSGRKNYHLVTVA